MEKTGSDQALHEEILAGLERMDGKDGSLGEFPRILKTILQSVQGVKLQPAVQLLDKRVLFPIVGLQEFMDIIVRYPRLAQEFHLHYLTSPDSSRIGYPLIAESDLQGMAERKAHRMADFLSGLGLENEWSMLNDTERRVAYASLFDQLSDCLIRAMQSHKFIHGFVEKYGFGKAVTDVVNP
jgi:hypothetical protein